MISSTVVLLVTSDGGLRAIASGAAGPAVATAATGGWAKPGAGVADCMATDVPKGSVPVAGVAVAGRGRKEISGAAAR